MGKHYTCYHFSLNLAKGDGQDNVPNLLRHLADEIDKMEEDIEVQDIVFQNNDIDENGVEWPGFTVYYHLVNGSQT